MIGEYIARIYVQAQARPLYNIAERLNFVDDAQHEDELVRGSMAPSPPSSPLPREGESSSLRTPESASASSPTSTSAPPHASPGLALKEAES
jgi:hypothetical protein